jgi:hypothetical protein
MQAKFYILKKNGSSLIIYRTSLDKPIMKK